MATQKDFLFKKMAVKSGLIAEEKIEELFQLQQQLEKDGITASLEKLILDQGLMSEEQLEHINKKIKSQMTLGATRELPPINRVIPAQSQKSYAHYELLEELGQGILGKVFKARDTKTDKKVAVKELASGEEINLADIERFTKELKKAKDLEHPNIARVYDVQKEGDMSFFAMELMDGQSLRTLLRNKRLSVPHCAEVVHKIALALHYAHQSGIYHRAITPGSIFIDKNGEPIITDFGLAPTVRGENVSGITIMGVPPYISPEQVRGIQRQVDGQSDVFCLGIIFYEMLTGQVPFSGRNTNEILDAVHSRPPKSPDKINDGIPQVITQVCMKALAISREERYSDALAMAKDLELFLQGEQVSIQPLQKQRDWIAPATFIAVLMLIILAVLRWLKVITF